MKFFFDNTMSPHLAHAIRELSKYDEEKHEVIHLRDRFKADEDDLVWIPDLARDGPWAIISSDRFNDAERQAIHRAGHTAFVLDKQWNKHPFWSHAKQMVEWWPLIIEQAKLVRGGAFCVPWRVGSKRRFDAIRL